MHRTPTDRRRLLHRLGQHHRPGPQTPTPGLDPIPLGHPTPPPTLTYWRTLLADPCLPEPRLPGTCIPSPAPTCQARLSPAHLSPRSPEPRPRALCNWGSNSRVFSVRI